MSKKNVNCQEIHPFPEISAVYAVSWPEAPSNIPAFWGWCYQIQKQMQTLLRRIEREEATPPEFQFLLETPLRCCESLESFGCSHFPPNFKLIWHDQEDDFETWVSVYSTPEHPIFQKLYAIDQMLIWSKGWCRDQMQTPPPHCKPRECNPFLVLIDVAIHVRHHVHQTFADNNGNPRNREIWEAERNSFEAKLSQLRDSAQENWELTGFPATHVKPRVQAVFEAALSLLLWERDVRHIEPLGNIRESSTTAGDLTSDYISHCDRELTRALRAVTPLGYAADSTRRVTNMAATYADRQLSVAQGIAWVRQECSMKHSVLMLLRDRPNLHLQDVIDRLWDYWRRMLDSTPPQRPNVRNKAEVQDAVDTLLRALDALEEKEDPISWLANCTALPELGSERSTIEPLPTADPEPNHTPDGPEPPYYLRLNGQRHQVGRGRKMLSYQILCFFWKHDVADYRELFGNERPWPDPVEWSTVQSAISRFNTDMPAEFPWVLRTGDFKVFKESR